MNIRALFASALLVAAAAHAEDQQTCKLRRAASIEMSMDRYGRPTIPVAVNGARLPFLIDTAGIFNAVTEETVKAAGLKTVFLGKQVIFNGVTGDIPTKAAVVDQLEIGPLPLKNQSLVVMTPRGAGNDIGGAVSGEFLHFFDIEFDFSAGRMNVFLQSECEDRVVYWTSAPHGVLAFETNQVPDNTEDRIFESLPDWHIVARAKLDGIDVDVTIDTGSSSSFMTIEDAQEIMAEGSTEKSLNRLDNDPDPSKAAYTYPFKTLILGDIAVKNPDIVLMHNKIGKQARLGQIRPHLILGCTVLRRLRFYVAYGEKRIYFTDAAAK